jgi:hypothetical protein
VNGPFVLRACPPEMSAIALLIGGTDASVPEVSILARIFDRN